MDRRHLLVALGTVVSGCSRWRSVAGDTATTTRSRRETPTSAPNLQTPNGVVSPAGGIESVERDGNRVRVETFAGSEFEYALVTLTRTDDSGTELSIREVERQPPLQNALAYLGPDVRRVELRTSVSNGDALADALQKYPTTTGDASDLGPFRVESVSFTVTVGKTG